MARGGSPLDVPGFVEAVAHETLVRNAAIVLSEVARGNTPGTPQQLAGYSLSLAAFGCYTRLRMQGTNKSKAA